jgi:hypothetical protein
MNPTMMRMIVKAEQDEKIRRAERQRAFNGWPARNQRGPLKKLALGLVTSGVIVLLISWVITV